MGTMVPVAGISVVGLVVAPPAPPLPLAEEVVGRVVGAVLLLRRVVGVVPLVGRAVEEAE